MFCVEERAMSKADTITVRIECLLSAGLFRQQSTQDLRVVLIRILALANEVQALVLILTWAISGPSRESTLTSLLSTRIFFL